MHAALNHVRGQGVEFVPRIIPAADGASFVSVDGHFWELTEWAPGEADFLPEARPEKLAAAMTALARFHRAAESFPLDRPASGRPPGILQRLARLDELAALDWHRDAIQNHRQIWPDLAARADLAIRLIAAQASRVRRRLVAAAELQVALQPCIRDVWNDHILFTGSEVTGLIDFGAMRIDHIATDVARLLGSLVGDDRSKRDFGLQAYQALRPLSPDEQSLLLAYDRSATLLSPLSWLVWTFVDRRQFDRRDVILERFDRLIDRLRRSAVD
jgi:homoserine kinase type II